MGAVFVDLDRTILHGASGPALEAALVAEGVLVRRRAVRVNGLLYGLYDRFGESLVAMGLARAASLVARGWARDAVRRAGERAVDDLKELVAPFAPEVLARYRAQGRRLVLATTTPFDLIEPFALAMGFDEVIATRYEVEGGRYTGRLEGGFVWGLGKLQAVRRWADAHGVDLADCDACSDSFFDVPLLSSVGRPHAVNPDPSLGALARARRWPVEHWDRPPGVPSLLGFEPYHLLRPFVRPETFPYARFDVQGLEHIPDRGPVVLASNHRSYFDVAALAVVAARIGRPVRFLGKRELFDAPIIGWVARSLGGIPVDREGSARSALERAASALRAGEVVLVLPQGTIPRGEDFFRPVLTGKTGAVRLARQAGAPLVPIGLWGTEVVWPRSSRVPDLSGLLHPPRVTVRVGAPVDLGSLSAEEGTTVLMRAITGLLPPEAAVHQSPGEEQIRRTHPPRARAVGSAASLDGAGDPAAP